MTSEFFLLALLTLLKKFHEHHIIKMPNYSNFIKGVWNFSNNSKKKKNQNCEFVAVVIAVSVKKSKTNKKKYNTKLKQLKEKGRQLKYCSES